MPRRSNPIKLNPPSLRDTSLTGKYNSFAKQTEIDHSPFTTHNSLKSTAFTLAEVLITLGIIGIVAAIIMPSVMLNVRNQKLKAQFKTANSIITRAVQKMSADNPNIVGTYCGYSIYDILSMPGFSNDFAKYFTNAKVMQTNNLQKLGYKSSNIRTISNKTNLNPYFKDGYPILLNNGMVIIPPYKCQYSGLPWGTPRPVGFLVDINGPKGPNRIGFDIFDFQIIRNNVIAIHNTTYAKTQLGSSEQLDYPSAYCNYQTGTDSTQGLGCTKYAALDKSPQDKNKGYFENLPAK